MLKGFIVAVIIVVGVCVGAVLASAALDWPSDTVRTETVIDAPRRDVWGTLTDFPRYDDWNPFITSVSGAAREGADVDMRLRPPGAEAENVDATVKTVRVGRKLRWSSRLLVPGLRDREYEVTLEPIVPGRVRVKGRIRYEGVLVPLSGLEDSRRGLERMFTALKRRAEADSSSLG